MNTQRSNWPIYAAVGLLAVVAVGIFLAPMLLFRPAAADPGTQASGPTSQGPGVTFAPGQPVNPANNPVDAPPAFVVPGARLTWYAAGASVANSRFSWVEEPCTPQSWTDRQSGKCYRRTDESGEGQPGASGDGLSQLDIVAVDGPNAVIQGTLYTFFRENNTLLWNPIGGGSFNAINLDGGWVHPAQLAQIAQSGLGGFLVLRGNYRLGMTDYDALGVVSGLGTSSYASYTYDLNSGLLLSANTSSGGVTSPIRAEGESAPTGNSQLTMARFAGYRARNSPGLEAAKPDWVNGTSQLTYQGTYNFINPVDPSSANLTYPVEFSAQLGQGGATWSAFNGRTTVPQLGMDSTVQGVATGNGPLWFDPQTLAQLSAGQVLDEDGLTGERISVAFVGQGGNGQPVVAIDSQMPGKFVRSTYELDTGMLLGFDLQQQNAGTTISVQLVDRR